MAPDSDKQLKATKQRIGDEPPIPAGGRRRPPDRREVSLRWLSGTFLTGLTSTVLMGVALFAGLDGKQFLATPPELQTSEAQAAPDLTDNAKTHRLPALRAAQQVGNQERTRMSVSTVTRVGDADLVRTKPFEHLKVSLAAGHKAKESYPAFNPLSIFAQPDQQDVANENIGSLIYGADVETEASIRVVSFEFDETMTQASLVLSNQEVEEIVRQTAPILTDGSVEVAALHFVNPERFGLADPALSAMQLQSTAKIVPQNISVASIDNEFRPSRDFSEYLIEVRSTAPIRQLLADTEFGKSEPMAEALETLLNTENFKEGHAIRLGLQGSLMGQNIIRASVYSGNNHQTTIALNDKNQYVPSEEPFDEGVMEARKERDKPKPPVNIVRDLPPAYDAIYRGVMAYDLPKEIAGQIVRMVAADVDFRSPIKPSDRLELFYSVPEQSDETTEELLFVEASFNEQTRKFYRFISTDGTIDYFDEDGKSARQFLLRNPVPNGKFRSPFGMRRHPILKYSKMHWGVDWSAPRGTPIIAPGNGTVIKAGWAGGYGRQTVIRHANGYETSYSHQTRFAKGISQGARVRQGQVIGYVGTTGLSTGPHLHYEMKVNNKRVDPLRVRLPEGKSLSGEELAAFIRERDRINDLLEKSTNPDQQVALAN